MFGRMSTTFNSFAFFFLVGLAGSSLANDSIKPSNIFDKVEFFHSRERRAADSNKTVTQNQTVQDDHQYYTSKFVDGKDLWKELEGNANSIKHWNISNGPTKYAELKLKFKFPYYGHLVENISVTDEGFLYTGWVSTRFDIMRQVMYVAPLMAYFNPAINNSASIYYLSTDDQFTVQWNNIYLEREQHAGAFTFQCTLFKSGKIHFAYKSVPKNVTDIQGYSDHGVRVGLSDAFTVTRQAYLDGKIILVRIFYRYHEIALEQSLVRSDTGFILQPKANCISATSCDSCREVAESSDFSCKWCNTLQRCSDSIDRNRVEWFQSFCNYHAIITECAGNFSTVRPPVSDNHGIVYASKDKQNSGLGAGAIVGICLVVAFIVAAGAWCLFAYTHPTSSSGLFLISLRYRPRELFGRGDSSGGGGVNVESTTKSSSLA
ncbi:plexin domain-containing protein 2 isoform X3 [Nematostella vectensis]|uniref:plexin domain-containing protein 2 isoform X3 n=1 Tax=Nematostella vectensis TaxID=45351 RepID=UPI002076E916|nr:plexin domain-containing protein 2 isoform X3 [Nematostella vectensis]